MRRLIAIADLGIGGREVGQASILSERIRDIDRFRPHVEELRLVPSPMVVARMGRAHSRPLREDWNEVKDDIMRRAVLRKFESNADIREILLNTGNEELIEQTTDDYYWGCGTDGTGKNMLGKILMEVREQLRARNG